MPKEATGADAVFDRVAALPVPTLTGCLAGQAPQTAAALLLRFPPAVAAAVLAGLAEESRHRILRRMATTGPAVPVLIDRIAEALREDLLTAPTREPARPGERLAGILGLLPPDARGSAEAALATSPPHPAPPAAPDAEPAAPPDVGLARLSPGLAALVNSRVVIRDRMPMLEVVLDRHVRMLAPRLRSLCGDDSAEAGLRRLSSIRFGDWMNDVARAATTSHPLIAVFRSRGWDHYGLILVDETVRESVADAALGGAAGHASDRMAGRAPTGLDRCALALLAEGCLDDLNAAFEPVGTPDFRLDRIEANPRFTAIDRPFNACFLAELDVRVGESRGRIGLLLPYALLEPVRGRLTRAFVGERFGHDDRWAAHLRGRLPHARLRVDAVAGKATVTLGAALGWRPGDLIGLDARDGADATLVAGGSTVGRGRLGQAGGRHVVTPRRALDVEGETRMTESGDMDTGNRVGGARTAPREDRPAGGLSALHQVKLRLSAVVGGADMTVEELLQLGRGAVVELDRQVGELIDVTVNGQTVARGELVVVDDRLAVSLTDIVGAPG